MKGKSTRAVHLAFNAAVLADALATALYAAASLTAMLTEGCCPAYLAEFAILVVLAESKFARTSIICVFGQAMRRHAGSAEYGLDVDVADIRVRRGLTRTFHTFSHGPSMLAQPPVTTPIQPRRRYHASHPQSLNPQRAHLLPCSTRLAQLCLLPATPRRSGLLPPHLFPSPPYRMYSPHCC